AHDVPHRAPAVDDVRVGRDEAGAEVVPSAEERLEDVVVLPVAVLDVTKLGVARAEDVTAIPAHEDHVLAREARLAERLEDSLEHRPAHHRDERLGQLVGPVLEAATPTGSDEDGTHEPTLPWRGMPLIDHLGLKIGFVTDLHFGPEAYHDGKLRKLTH